MLAVNAREALRSLTASKQRTLLALIGVIIGIGSVMAMLGLGETVKAEALRQFNQMGTDVLTVRPGFGAADDRRQPQPLLPEDMTLLARYAQTVRSVSPEVEIYGKVRSGPAELSGNVKGVWPAFAEINRLKMTKGRFLTDYDRGSPFAVLGHSAFQKLIDQGARRPLNEITIMGRPYSVIGVLAPAELGYNSQTVDEAVLVPLDMAQRFSQEPGLNQASVRLWPNVDHDLASAEINNLLNQFKGESVNLHINSPRQLLEQISRQMRLYTMLLAAVGSISLIVGGVGIMNMMLVSVTERRREIGIRRAMGAQRKDIVSQFLVESMLLSLAGGIIGVALGQAVSLIAASVQGWQQLWVPGAILLCLGVSLAVGLFFGYYPARKAAGLDVIVALRAD
jgi:putative ABC transport system permease protein